MLSYFTNLSPVILGILGLLGFFSIVSWTIIAYKLIQIRAVRKNTKAFLDFFWDSPELSAVKGRIDDYDDCPLALLFKDGYRETEHFLSRPADGSAAAGPGVSAIDSVARSLRKSSSQEIEKLEKNLSFLATTGSTTPFIGLFGTVWGIMIAFRQIGLSASTSLDVVAPGISEALVTTAIGLAVAIPAVIGYNYLQSKIKGLVSEIENFTYDFLNIAQKIFNAQK
jgi:biopolymer transport protein TolQ